MNNAHEFKYLPLEKKIMKNAVLLYILMVYVINKEKLHLKLPLHIAVKKKQQNSDIFSSQFCGYNIIYRHIPFQL